MTTDKKSRMIKMNSSHHVKKVPVGPPIAPAVISRGPVFQPRFKNLRTETIKWETPWVEVTVTGRIGGIHRKVLDAIFGANLGERAVSGGARLFAVDPYQIARVAGIAHHPHWLLKILKDMQDADVTLKDKSTGLRHWAHIISEVQE